MLLSGCGGGGGGGSSSSVTGFLIDGAVEGVEYTCGSTTGLTGSDGAFSCTAFPVTFKIGSITLGSIATLPNDSKVLPQDLVGVDRNSTNDQKVLNIAQLLQSLDDDNNPANGIKITSAIKAGFTQAINLQQQTANQVQDLVTGTGKAFVDSNTAQAHLEGNTPGFVSQTPIVDTTAPSAPTLTTTPTTTTENSVIVEVNGEVGAAIFVDGVDSSVVIASTGKANLTLDTSGAGGDKIFAITLRDSSSNISDTLTVTITKSTPVQQTPPTMGDVPNQSITQDAPMTNLDISNYVTQTDGDPISSYTLTGSLPTGVSFDNATGILSGTATQSGSFNLSVTATDDDGESNSDSFTLTVNTPADTTPPATPTGFSINGGATHTSSTTVNVDFTNSDDITGWYLSESNTNPAPEDFVAQMTTANLSAGDGVKTLYLFVKDANDNIQSVAATATIILDTGLPSTPTLTTIPTHTNQDSVTVEVNGEVGTTIFVNTTDTNTDINASGKANLDLNTSGADGIKSFSITLKDSANNESEALDINITKDTVAPTKFSWVYGIDGVGDLTNRMVTFDENITTGVNISRSNGGTVSNIAVSDNNISFSYTKINTDENITIQGTDLAGNSFDITRGTKIILKTGQTTSYVANDDGAYQKGVSRSYTDNGDDTVTDNATGLIWQQEDDNIQRNWADAGTYCGNLDLGGSTDWRLPTIEELKSLVDYGTSIPAINVTYFTGTISSGYWSSTTYANDSNEAWNFNGEYGSIGWWNKTLTYNVHCVRDMN